MAHEDFDLDSLAAYLHLNPSQVQKMAGRGKIPGRKIGGEWRFSPAEIHHWFEDRIGASDEQQLVEVEGVLEQQDRNDSDSVSIHRLLGIDTIAVPLPARTRNSVLTEMANLAATSGLLWDPQKMSEALRDRENLHPTALDNGVALLHPRRPMPSILAEPLMAFGRTYQGVPFGGARGGLTDLFFLICSYDDRGHLRTLARLSRLIADAEFLSGLRAADSPTETLDWIRNREEDLFEQ